MNASECRDSFTRAIQTALPTGLEDVLQYIQWTSVNTRIFKTILFHVDGAVLTSFLLQDHEHLTKQRRCDDCLLF